ncbi:MAG: SAM-dependent DNA methyltransferase [Ignavibacteria bacterium]|nr:SAM-dependent DNA methyltransferase [Ignavibacteria bacterium]
MPIKKSDLYSSLWASCDELRGGMDASQYKDYVLFMLFIKYVSDKYGDSDDFAPPVNIPKGASFKDMVALKGNADIGNLINTQVIQPLIDANTRLARSDFPDFNDSNKLGDGAQKVEKLGNLIAIFENPALDFSKNRAENDDILGDAYEYLMRHFATESGKSKGQFYTPSEVSRIIAKVIGISPANSKAATTAYDPTCGSGSLLLKVAAEAGKHITLEGQEMDVTTAGLARMNMILHDFPTANIQQGNTLSSPKFKDGEQLRTYDYVVANPPFSVKTWSTGLTPSADPYHRFAWGEPPAKQGDYAFLLHIVRSLKSTGKGACILPHGVLFRGNAEAVIRMQLVRSGYLKAIIGLPANLFYGTGIPACILVLDKENAVTRKGIFMIDASKGFKKDGPKNRLREQDLHKIVDTFIRQDESDPRFARIVPIDEIADPKNDFNLNIPRYIDSTEPEDLQDIDAHLRGGIPDRDLEALGHYWRIMPSVRSALFTELRPGYSALGISQSEIKASIFAHPEFAAFTTKAKKLFTKWQSTSVPFLKGLAKDGHPKQLIETIAEDLLATFRTAPLLDAYDVYQHLMDYWAETMQDDCYLIADAGWIAGVKPREIVQVKNKENKLVWPEKEDFKKGKRRFKSDLVPAALLIARYFITERDTIFTIETELAGIEQQLDEKREEHGGEEGLLADVFSGETEEEKEKITQALLKTRKANAKARLKEICHDPDYADERQALEDYNKLLDNKADAKTRLKTAQEDLEAKLDAKYPTLTEDEIKTLVVDDKWLATLAAAVQGELDRVSQTLTGRIHQLAERYDTPLPQLTDEVATLAARVDEHLKKMGAVWK